MRLLVWDTETDGVDTLNGHIVSATLLLVDTANSALIEAQRSWLLDFGGEIPEGASNVHGISTERMRAEGRKDFRVAIGEILDIINFECIQGSAILTAYNARFDFTLLETERLRHVPECPPLFPSSIVAFDPLVAWKHAVPRKRGKRRLENAADSFNIPFNANAAHDAAYDCFITGQVAAKLLQHPKIRGLSPQQLHRAQIGWAREQADSLQAYFNSVGRSEEHVEREWPVVSRPETVAA